MTTSLRWMSALTISCVFSLAAHAQPPAAGEGITGIAHVAFRVSDLNRETAFFNQLGYQVAFSMTSGGATSEVFIKVNDRQFIELYPRTDASQPLGWMHVCFEAGDLDRLQKYYVSENLNPSPVRKGAAGNLIVSFNDPEGRVTEFTQYMPGSRHSLDRGQHLGADRVSEELMGIDLPVRDGAAMKEFYVDLGFEAEEVNSNVRLTAPGAPDLHLTFRPARAGSRTQLLYSVANARKTQERLEYAGVTAERNGKLVFVNDPDGNSFVFLETGGGR